MVSWSGSKYKFDFDVANFCLHSVFVLGMLVTAFYLIRVASSVVWEVHRRIVPTEAQSKGKKDT